MLSAILLPFPAAAKPAKHAVRKSSTLEPRHHHRSRSHSRSRSREAESPLNIAAMQQLLQLNAEVVGRSQVVERLAADRGSHGHSSSRDRQEEHEARAATRGLEASWKLRTAQSELLTTKVS